MPNMNHTVPDEVELELRGIIVQQPLPLPTSSSPLSPPSHPNEHIEENAGVNNFQSPEPVDKGRAAWRLLLSAFVFESLLWGFPLSFGVFQNYYSNLDEFSGQRYISVIGTTASGISYMGAPVVIPVIRRCLKYRRYMIWGGWTLCISGVLASSFARSVWVLIFTQGVMYGVGFTVFYYPIISMVNEFWIARRGMAYGLLCASTGFSGAFMPFVIEILLHRYGRLVTLRAMVVALAILTGPLIPGLKGRTPDGQQVSEPKTDKTFLTVPLFWIYSISNLLQGLGVFFPSLYLPSFASAIGLNSTQGALLLALMSVSQTIGQFSFGYLSDRNLSLNLLSMTSTLISAVAILALWGLAHNFAVLCVFALLYGFFGVGYSSMWARMGNAVTNDSTAAFAAFGTFNLGKGVGNVLTGPVGANLMESSVDLSSFAVSKYQAIVLFAGSCMLASTASTMVAYIWPLKPASQQ